MYTTLMSIDIMIYNGGRVEGVQYAKSIIKYTIFVIIVERSEKIFF